MTIRKKIDLKVIGKLDYNPRQNRVQHLWITQLQNTNQRGHLDKDLRLQSHLKNLLEKSGIIETDGEIR